MEEAKIVLVSLNFFDLALKTVIVKHVWHSYGMFRISLLVSKKSSMVEINPFNSIFVWTENPPFCLLSLVKVWSLQMLPLQIYTCTIAHSKTASFGCPSTPVHQNHISDKCPALTWDIENQHHFFRPSRVYQHLPFLSHIQYLYSRTESSELETKLGLLVFFWTFKPAAKSSFFSSSELVHGFMNRLLRNPISRFQVRLPHQPFQGRVRDQANSQRILRRPVPADAKLFRGLLIPPIEQFELRSWEINIYKYE